MGERVAKPLGSRSSLRTDATAFHTQVNEILEQETTRIVQEYDAAVARGEIERRS